MYGDSKPLLNRAGADILRTSHSFTNFIIFYNDCIGNSGRWPAPIQGSGFSASFFASSGVPGDNVTPCRRKSAGYDRGAWVVEQRTKRSEQQMLCFEGFGIFGHGILYPKSHTHTHRLRLFPRAHKDEGGIITPGSECNCPHALVWHR